MFALAALAALGASAAPWFNGWGNDAVARSAAASATVADRLVLGASSVSYNPAVTSPLETLRTTVAANIPIAGSDLDVGARIFATVRPGGLDDEDRPAARGPVNLYVVTRTRICDQLTLVEGACPEAPGDVALVRDAATRLGVGVGDPITVRGFQMQPATLRVSGLYVVTDPHAEYWAGTPLLRELGATDADTNPAVVSERTLPVLRPTTLQFDVHLLLPTSAFADPTVDLRGTLRRATPALQNADVTLTVPAYSLLNRIARDRLFVALGVTVGAGQLVLVSWVALFLAVRHTAEERRADIGLLKLRGTPPRRLGTLIGLSSGLPMLAGTVVGAAAGFVGAAAFAYRSAPDLGPLALTRTGAIPVGDTLLLSLLAAVVAGLGGLAVAMVAESRLLRAPVVDLLRRVPGGHRGWRADVLDLVVVVIAGAGVYQGWVEARAGGDPSVLALLAPALVALAVALLVARALPPVAARAGKAALRAGRVGAALAALQLARRPGTQRVFTVLTVAAAVFAAATVLWQSATTAWHQRAVQELGADRVLSVDAPSAAALLTAVRSVDPSGRYAMAVATTIGVRTEDRVVAIDTPRYAAVGRLPEGLPAPADLAALLRPAALPELAVANAPVALDVTGPEAGAVEMRLHLSTATGQAQVVAFPALAAGRSTVQAGVTGCVPACRLIALEVAPRPGTPLPVTVELHALRQPTGLALDAEALGDITRWRTTLDATALPPAVTTQGGRLAITIAPGAAVSDTAPDHRVLPLTNPVPLPVAVAGPSPQPRDGVAAISALGGTDVPFVVAARVPALPNVGDRGVLVDLEYALHSNDASTESAQLSVWLTADAPDSVVAGLADHGVTVIGERSVAQRASEFAGQAPGIALGFGYFAAALVLLLAAGVAVVGSTVDRPSRVAELAALRGQGVSSRPLWTAGLAGSAAMVAAATVAGLAAALVAGVLVSAGLPAFADGWDLLPPPGLTGTALLVATVVVLVVLGAAALAAAGRLVAAATARFADRSTKVDAP
jgi:putative ABC transport system permease protein